MVAVLAVAGGASAHAQTSAYAADLARLGGYDTALVILRAGDAEVVTSARYQGKVLTSTSGGGESHGYLDYGAFALDTPAAHINAYGGESRLWLGPEAGPHAIFFAGGVPFESDYWFTPAAIDHEPWELVSAADTAVRFRKAARLRNRLGTAFAAEIGREVRVIAPERLAGHFGAAVAGLRGVGYETINTLRNVGDDAWTRASGTLCLWVLDMLPATDSAVVFALADTALARGDVRDAGYFGAVPDARLAVVDSAVMFRGDAAAVGKFGLSPARAAGRLGSLDLARGVLTVIDYDVDAGADYLAMAWSQDVDPYAGDAVTSYNADGAAGGRASFFELESVAPAAFLSPGASATHRHDVAHFVGPRARLLAAAGELFGVGPAAIAEFLAR